MANEQREIARADEPGNATTRRLWSRLAGVSVFVACALAVASVVVASLHLRLPFGLNVEHAPSSGVVKPTRRSGHATPRSVPTITITAIGLLSVPTSRIAAVPLHGGALLMGGYDSAGNPTDIIEKVQNGNVTKAGTLPTPDASAVGAVIGSSVFLLGGDSSTIYQLSEGRFVPAGTLPTPTADAAVATVGDVAYVIGGYDGASDLDTIVAFAPSAAALTVATLPVGLRYSAAAELGGDVYIIGGSTSGVLSAKIYRFDPMTDSVTTFETLPHGLDRAGAARLDGSVYVIGGENASGRRTRAIYRIGPAGGVARLAGALPYALADTAAVTGNGKIILAGGTFGTFASVATIYALKLRSSECSHACG